MLNSDLKINSPITKKILILANSIKKFPNRCVAGIEMEVENGTSVLGKWIRLIDPSQREGALPYARTLLQNCHPVRPLQLIEAEFDGQANDPYHPEDWILRAGSKITHLDNMSRAVLEEIPDQSEDLWGHTSAAKRSVPAGSARATLKLVKPKHEVIVELSKEYDSYKGKDRLKKTLTILNDGVEHKFNITDPLFDQRYGINPSGLKAGQPVIFTLKPEGLAIVVSLTPPLNGQQYKIAAAILEP